MNITEKTTLEAWKAALNSIINDGHDYMDNERKTREMLNLMICIEEPTKDITKPIEIMRKSKKWVYPPLEEIESIILSKKLAPAYSYSYGPRIFNYNTINQIDKFVVPLLKKDHFSRRAVVTLWDPVIDANIFKKDVPGLIMIDFKLRNNKIHATSFVRSNDIFFGWPANIYQIYSLVEYLSKQLNCEIGSLTTFSSSAHIFEDQFESINKILKDGHL
jgi:thymidylate synthase